jgi:lipoate-protein ligase A
MVNSSKSVDQNPGRSPDLSWRLIPYQRSAAGLNMAIDRYLLETRGRSILRFYGWQKPTISLGYHQRRIPAHWLALAQDLDLGINDQDLDRSRLQVSGLEINQPGLDKLGNQLGKLDKGIDIVRRPSGGRAVLHQHDLTYAIVTRARPGSRNQTYRYICQFLINGFAKLGIKVGFGESQRNYLHHPSCFNTATNADLVVADGRKLVGSAQVYQHGWVLQHGAIAIQPDYAMLRQVFATDVPIVGLAELLADGEIDYSLARLNQSVQVEEQGTIANSQTGLINSLINTLIEALSKAASEHFQVELISQPLSNSEIAAIAKLEQHQFD